MLCSVLFLCPWSLYEESEEGAKNIDIISKESSIPAANIIENSFLVVAQAQDLTDGISS
jgi:hypothetical protein